MINNECLLVDMQGKPLIYIRMSHETINALHKNEYT